MNRCQETGGAFARYSPTGHLLFVRGGALFAVPFDLNGTRVTGPEVVIAPQVAVDPWVGGAHYAVAFDGTVLFVRGRFLEPERRLVWVDRDGQAVAGGARSSPARCRLPMCWRTPWPSARPRSPTSGSSH